MSPPSGMPYRQEHTSYDEKPCLVPNYSSQVGPIEERTMIETELNGNAAYPPDAAFIMQDGYNQMPNVATSMSTNYGMPQIVSSQPPNLPHSSGQYMTTQSPSPLTTPGNHSAVPANQILSMEGDVTHFYNSSSNPNLQMEINPLLFGPSGNDACLSHRNNNTVDSIGFLDINAFQPSVAPSLAHAPQVRQSVVDETRARYSGSAPIKGGVHASEIRGQREVGCVKGHTPKYAGGHGDTNTDTASQSISQWSQWLKNGASEPVY